ncbi:MAG: calcium/proton exchanger, partial [Thermomicrobiales bacterium]
MKLLHVLLLAIPVTLFLEFTHHGNATVIFILSALSMAPLAGVLGEATEEVAIYTGPKIGALLNATLGNAAELIITVVALRAGLVDVVKASIAGSIIGNILIVLGLSLFLGGVKNGIQRFDA